MIDFIKLAIPAETAKKIEDTLDFELRVSEKTGEVKTKRVAEDQSLKFIFWQNHFQVSGSIHKYYHNGENYSQFSFQHFLDAVQSLHDLYGIEPTQARLMNLEVGLNLPALPLPALKITGSCIAHKGASFNKMKRRYNDHAVGVEVCHQQYILKIYDKAKQYNLPYPLLRVEAKFIKMKVLNDKDIFYLSDLCKTENLPVLRQLLCGAFSEVVMNEPQLHLSKLSSSERRKMANYKNPLWWEEKRQKTSRQNCSKHHHKFTSIISRYVPVTTQQIILNAMEEKWDELAVAEAKMVDELTDFLKPKSCRINPLCKGLDSQPKKCIITGMDISNQRPGSKYISEKNSDYQFAHWARNCDSNKRHNLRRKITRYEDQLTLFPMNQYLRLSDEEEETLSFWNGTPYEVRLHSQ